MRTTAHLLLGAIWCLSACSRDARPPEGESPKTPTVNATSTPPANNTAPAASASVASASPAPSETAAANDSGEDKVPDIEYVPTPQNVVDKMLEVAKVTKNDVLYDLGCGDGRIVITAAKKFGVKAFGFDVDPQRIKESNENAKKAGVENLVKFEKKDVFTVDLSPATVVTLYLLPELNVRLIPQLEKLKSGSRIVSHDFDMEGVEWEKWWTVMAKDHRTPKDREHYVYLWKTPLKKRK
jgi:SAM-dependent methyltransferase